MPKILLFMFENALFDSNSAFSNTKRNFFEESECSREARRGSKVVCDKLSFRDARGDSMRCPTGRPAGRRAGRRVWRLAGRPV